MARWRFQRRKPSEAFADYCRAKHVWQVLARKRREHPERTTFSLDPAFLTELGFASDDLRGSIRDLQHILTRMQEVTWHWDRRGPLMSRPGEPGPVAYILDDTLVLGPQFTNVRAAFMAYPGRESETGSGPAPPPPALAGPGR